jgi:hypothetical protein
MTKMTDEDVERVLTKIGHDLSLDVERGVRAHIAAVTAELRDANNTVRAARAAQDALTAERDEARREREQFRDDLVRASEFAHQGGTGSPVTQEGRDAIESIGGLWNKRDALRERVKALEHDLRGYEEVLMLAGEALRMDSVTGVALVEGVRRVVTERDAVDRERNGAALRMETAESRLAAIRDRAGDKRACWEAYMDELCDGHRKGAVAAVARFILGDEAPPSEMDGLRGEMAERICEHDVVPCTTCHPPASPEPTTAEACATVRAWVEDKTHRAPESWRAATEALSLLERRMGAMGRAAALAPHGAHCAFLVSAPVPWKCDCWKRDALADAPPVFTLEEVRNAGEVVAEDVEPGPVALTDGEAEAYASGWARGARTVADRLPALRK